MVWMIWVMMMAMVVMFLVMCTQLLQQNQRRTINTITNIVTTNIVTTNASIIIVIDVIAQVHIFNNHGWLQWHAHQWLLCQACRWLHIHFWRSPHTSLLLFIPHTWHTHTLAVTHNTDCEQLLYIFILCNIEKLYLIIIFKLCAMHTDLCALWFDCFVIYVVVIVH